MIIIIIIWKHKLWRYTGLPAGFVEWSWTSVQARMLESQFLQSREMRLPRPSDSFRVCPRETHSARAFSLCLNTVAWQLNATEGYRLSGPIWTEVTHLLYVDDLKVFEVLRRVILGRQMWCELTRQYITTLQNRSTECHHRFSRVWYKETDAAKQSALRFDCNSVGE